MCGGGGQTQAPFNPAFLNASIPDVGTGYGVAEAHAGADMLEKKYPWLLPDPGRFAGEKDATSRSNPTNPTDILLKMFGGQGPNPFARLNIPQQEIPSGSFTPATPMPQQAAPQLPQSGGISPQQILALMGQK